MVKAIQVIDSKIQVRLFPSLESLFNWTKLLLEVGAPAVARGGITPEIQSEEFTSEGGPDRLSLLIIKSEFLGAQNLSLIKKIREALIQKKVCTPEDPTSIVLTAFDQPEFSLKALEDRIINNVVFKPFDPLILIQHLTFAIDGRHPASKYTIANQRADAILEVLKDVEMEMISDVGFSTIADSPISKGAVAKYYSEYFSTEYSKSMMAVCVESQRHPTIQDKYRCWFQYFSPNTLQLGSIRRLMKSKTSDQSVDWSFFSRGRSKLDNIQVLSLAPEENDSGGLVSQISERYKNCYTTHYKSFEAFLSDLDPSQNLKNRPNDWKICSLGNEFSMIFDRTGSLFIGLVQDQKTIPELFGLPENTLKARGAWFQNALDKESKNKFKKIVREGIKDLTEDLTLSITVDGRDFLIRVFGLEVEDKKIIVKFSALTETEELDWHRKHSQLPDQIDVLFISEKFLGEDPKTRLSFIKEQLTKRSNGIAPGIFLISQTIHSDNEKRELSTVVDNILQRPIDRIHFWHVLQLMFPQLRGKDAISNTETIQINQSIKVAMPVKFTEISEAGFIMQYHRSIEIGDFREVILWQPYEIESKEIIATCNYSEASKDDPKIQLNHFVFFGATDGFLKQVRIWIRDNYILSKQVES